MSTGWGRFCVRFCAGAAASSRFAIQTGTAAPLRLLSPPWLSRPGDDDRPRIVVLVANHVFGAAPIFGHRKPLLHQFPRPPQLLRRQMDTRPLFPLSLEFFQRLAALLVRAPHAPRPSAWHSACGSKIGATKTTRPGAENQRPDGAARRCSARTARNIASSISTSRR